MYIIYFLCKNCLWYIGLASELSSNTWFCCPFSNCFCGSPSLSCNKILFASFSFRRLTVSYAINLFPFAIILLRSILFSWKEQYTMYMIRHDDIRRCLNRITGFKNGKLVINKVSNYYFKQGQPMATRKGYVIQWKLATMRGVVRHILK